MQRHSGSVSRALLCCLSVLLGGAPGVSSRGCLARVFPAAADKSYDVLPSCSPDVIESAVGRGIIERISSFVAVGRDGFWLRSFENDLSTGSRAPLTPCPSPARGEGRGKAALDLLPLPRGERRLSLFDLRPLPRGEGGAQRRVRAPLAILPAAALGKGHASGVLSHPNYRRGRAEKGAAQPHGQPLQFNGQRAFDDLKRVVAFGPRPPGSKALVQSRQWITSQLKLDGCEVEEDSFVASTPAGPIPMANLIAKAPGARPDVIIIAGHYDTKRFDTGTFVGANDGASSTALPLELGRLLCGRNNPVTYWLVLFDGEEALVRWSDTDKLYGSRHLVQKLSANGELSRIKAMILVDMIADAKLDIRRDQSSTPWLNDLVFNTAGRLGYSRFFVNDPTTIDDDHIPFVEAGVSAVDIIDLDYGPKSFASPNGYWHTPKDTSDKCSAASMTVVGRVMTAALEQLETSPKLR